MSNGRSRRGGGGRRGPSRYSRSVSVIISELYIWTKSSFGFFYKCYLVSTHSEGLKYLLKFETHLKYLCKV